MANALLEAAVTGDHIGSVVDDVGTVLRAKHSLGYRHTNTVGDALP